MTFQPVVTADGSLSCLDTLTGELCHNSAGAYTEAVHNYIKPSSLIETLEKQGSIRVLDACYGLGYNTWALINELTKSHIVQTHASKDDTRPFAVSVVAIEQSPEVLRFMPRILEHPTFDALKNKIDTREHNIYYRTLDRSLYTKEDRLCPHKTVISVVNGMRIELELWIADLREVVPKLTGNYDAVFHDPFSPQKMPELWTIDIFREYFRLLKLQKGRVLTYSAAAAVRGGLQEAGFTIAKTPGLGAKGGGTIAIAETNADIQAIGMSFDEWEKEYILSRAGIPYRDANLSLSRAQILGARQMEQANSSRPSGGYALKKKPSKHAQ